MWTQIAAMTTLHIHLNGNYLSATATIFPVTSVDALALHRHQSLMRTRPKAPGDVSCLACPSVSGMPANPFVQLRRRIEFPRPLEIWVNATLCLQTLDGAQVSQCSLNSRGGRINAHRTSGKM